MPNADAWISEVEEAIAEFARDHATAYARTKREQSGIFEIGCFLAVVDDYERQGFEIKIRNKKEGKFKYLTSPTGNPENFSYVVVQWHETKFDLRQQIRIRSHLHEDVTFTPDIVVLQHGAPIEQKNDPDYAGGKRGMFAVAAKRVLAVHECKSLSGFPELYISFLGMLLAVHQSLKPSQGQPAVTRGHLASTLFVGGESSALHLRMISALQGIYPLNIITGLHKGSWILTTRNKPMNRVAARRALPNMALNLARASVTSGSPRLRIQV